MLELVFLKQEFGNLVNRSYEQHNQKVQGKFTLSYNKINLYKTRLDFIFSISFSMMGLFFSTFFFIRETGCELTMGSF